jgi:acylphosphatase
MAADTADRLRLEATVRGRVQGVGFRYFVWREANALGLDGWVANRPDGAVDCRAEGGRETLERFVDRLREGPPGAWVERVDARWLAATGLAPGFGIRAVGHPGD